MGDALMNLPAIRLVRQGHPKAWITMMADESVAPLFQGHPDIDEVMPVSGARLKKDRRYRRALLRTLRRARFDAALISNPEKTLHCLAFLSGIPLRAGYRRKWGFLLNRSLPDKKDQGLHEIDNNLRLAKLISGAEWDGHLSLPVDAASRSEIATRMRSQWADAAEIIAVHPGTSNPAKRWPIARFAELSSRMVKNNYRVVLIGGEEERPVSAEVARAVPEAVDWTGRLSLKELTAFFGSGHVRALVSSDSGPVHIAWISGTPVVALYAKDALGSDPARWGPRDGKSVCLHSPISEISVQEVWDALLRVLEVRV